MDTMERDRAYIAEQLKFLRKTFRLTQENLADAAGIATRSVEKIESGRHAPEEQTLRSLARALNLDVKVFAKPWAAEEARQKVEMERALRKMVVVPTIPIFTASDFLGAFGQRDALRFDSSAVTRDDALEIVGAIGDWLRDLNNVWDECYMSQRVEYARSFVELCQQIEATGYVCRMGHYRQQARQKDRPTLVFDVGLVTILPNGEAEGTRYIIVQLAGAWESLESDRTPF